ncbi:MAG: ABC transporter ATP-binding protein, partial [bacterium]
MIITSDLVKEYNGKQVVKQLNLSIADKEIFGLLGPNGAGKTTTIRMMTTLSKISSGKIEVAGYDIARSPLAVKAKIGVIPQQLNIEKEFTVRENLHLHGLLYHMSKKERQQRTEELLDYVDLLDRIDERAGNLSGGLIRRLMIARALMHKPEVLFMDEPTVGLDPQSRRKIWDLIKIMREDGMTVLLTTHYIEEAENLCDRVGIIDHGVLIALGTVDEMKQKAGNFVLEYVENHSTKRLLFPDRASALARADALLTNFTIRETNLEDVFVQLTGKE